MISRLALHKSFTVFLRVSSLAAKMLLTLYMGRYLGLSDLGVYGLVFGSVMIATGVLGARLDYVVGRDLIGSSPLHQIQLMRDQIVFCLLNYVVFGLVLLALFFMDIAPAFILLSIFFISIFENLSHTLTTNMVALDRPVLSTFLFFVRAGLWCIVVAAVGLLFPETRTVNAVLIAWTFGGALGALAGLWVLRGMPWIAVLRIPIDWSWIKTGLIKSFPVWMGTIGGMTALSLDRFVVSYFLDLESVGVITFYGSFAFALLSLVHSGFFNFSYPQMIKHHQGGLTDMFWIEARQTGLQVAAFVAVAAIALGVLLPYSAPFFNKPELVAESRTFWLMLAGVWIRANADTFYFVLYAKHKDKPLWLGNLLYLMPVSLGNIIFVPLFGLEGVGITNILSSAMLLVWWYSCAVKDHVQELGTSQTD